MHNSSVHAALEPYLKQGVEIEWLDGTIPSFKIQHWSKGMLANAKFFGDLEFGPKYFKFENASKSFGDRWRAAIGCWDDKIVVDIGCGPGNLLAAVGGKPSTILGIDIALGALKHAAEIGYLPLLADAQNLPLKDGFADIVTLNATLHHCDNFTRVLTEAARLLRDGGILITDEDPVSTNVEYQGIAFLVHKARQVFPMYWLPWRRVKYRSAKEISLRLETEIHNQFLGDGVPEELFADTLTPLGFSVELYPHYYNVGDELFRGEIGRLGFKDNLIRVLTQSKNFKPPLSIACIAKKTLSKGP